MGGGDIMNTVIPNGAYTLDATAKTILLTNTTIKKENIRKIIDVDHNCLIYDSDRPVAGNNISLDPVTPGLFHFDCNGVISGSTLQITVDLPYVSVVSIDGGTP
jgi:hypothetical protein